MIFLDFFFFSNVNIIYSYLKVSLYIPRKKFKSHVNEKYFNMQNKKRTVKTTLQFCPFARWSEGLKGYS